MAQQTRLPHFNSLRTVHIVGVCGTLMGAFAAFLKRKGIQVSGSDQNVYPPMSDVLKDAGVILINGYRAENLNALGGRPDLVVIGNVIRADNPEARAAIDQGYPYSSLPEAMEQILLRETKNLVVAGTHGKTTTSSLLAHVLKSSQRNPNFFIGGVSQDLPFSFHISSIEPGNLFVLEGDEYDTAFWDKVPKFNHYLPDDVILTSIEYDHADIYPDFASVIRAFEGLVSRVRPGGKIIGCFDYPIIQEILSRTTLPVISYGTSPQSKASYTPGRIRVDQDLTRFEVLKDGKTVDELAIQLPGMHNIANVISVWIECRELGVDSAQLRDALRTFRGVRRRQEIRGEVNGVVVMDDFAHHPTAVRETLKALRTKYPKCRLVSVFEPRSATSRRKVFQKDYLAAFQESDLTYISIPFDQSRISPQDQFSSEMLVNDLIQSGKQASLMETVDGGVEKVVKATQPGDLIAVLSNGGFGGFIPKLIQALKNES